MENLHENNPVSIRPFIGAKDFELSRSFYNYIGFQEIVLNPSLSLFKWGQLGFYLQKAYVKDWIDNTMIFFEVENVEDIWETLNALELSRNYEGVRLLPIRQESWGRECFLHDPSGILWHFGAFF
ncbi:VOC family protein [Pedobacter sp. PWIIR3]